MVDHIKRLMRAKQIHIMHIMREGNKLPDYIANLVIKGGDCKFHHFKKLDSTG